MNWTERGRRGGSEDIGPDVELASALGSVDPESWDPSYWMRFRMRVTRQAGAELARRRLMAELTVEDVLSGWARAIVPMAVLAAGIAAVILMRSGSTGAPEHVTVEELLTAGLGDETIPATLSNDDGTASMIAFAGETF